jgi:hypothetical protein
MAIRTIGQAPPRAKDAPERLAKGSDLERETLLEIDMN